MNELQQKSCSQTRNFTSLALMCKRIIVRNLERYPAECFCCLEESHWESIVQMKYRMTAPKVAITSGPTLSDGRRQPVIPYKIMLEIETQNPHLAKSRITDEIVWKDCTNFQFKEGGHSRPEVMILPWRQQVEDMKRIGTGLESFWDRGNPLGGVGGGCSPVENNQEEAVTVQKERSSSSDPILKIHNLQNYISVLSSRPMSVPLLLQSGIGKAVKKFIKESTKVPSSRSVELNQINNDSGLPPFKSYLFQMEKLLNNWKTMASSTPSQDQDIPCSGRHRNTSIEQHLQDLEDVQKTTQWRDLFQVLSAREKMIIKTRGAKMRKIREDIEIDRHKIKSTKLKKAGNQSLSEKLLYGGDKPVSGAAAGSNNASSVAGGSGVGQVSKLNKLREESLARQKTISGLSAGTTKRATSSFGSSVAAAVTSRKPSSSTAGVSSFGLSVAASSGKKRKSVGKSLTGGDKNLQAFGSKRQNQRVFALGDGKKIKLPSTTMRGKK